MKRTRFFVVPLLLMGFSALAYADSVPVDPQMDVSDPPCVEGCPNPIGEGQGFFFTSNAQGGGLFTATNQSGGAWTSLLFTFSPVPGPFTCTSNGIYLPQDGCNVVLNHETGLDEIRYESACFENCSATSGIINNDTFFITLGMWPPGTLLKAYPNEIIVSDKSLVNISPVPEPGTITLLGVGLTVLLAKRRLRRRQLSLS